MGSLPISVTTLQRSLSSVANGSTMEEASNRVTAEAGQSRAHELQEGCHKGASQVDQREESIDGQKAVLAFLPVNS